MSPSIFKKTTLSLAIAAAVVAPQVANAAVAVNAVATSTFTLQAPFTTAFQAGYGKRVTINITRTDGASDDTMQLYAFLYQNGAYVGTVKSAAPTAVLSQSVVLPDISLPYNQVTFAYLTQGGTVDDTWETVNSLTRVIKVTPNSFATRNNAVVSTGLSAVDVSTITGGVYTAALATNPQLAEIGALAAMKANPISLSSYAGPTMASAQTDNTLNGTDVKLSFDATLKAIADNNTSSIGTGNTVITVAGVAVPGAVAKGAVIAGDYIVRFDSASAAFAGLISTVENKLVIGNDCTGANLISDEAGNCPAAITKTVTKFAAPQFATTGAVKNIVTGGTGITAGNVKDLFTTAGLTLAIGNTVDVTLRLDENFNGVGADNIDDLSISGSSTLVTTGVTVTGANAKTIVVRFTATAAGEVLKVDAAGKLLVNGSELKIGLAVGASALTTSEGIALATPVAGVNVSVGIVPAAAVVTTADDNANGVLDGVHFKFGAPIKAPLAATTGIKLIDKDVPATTVASVLTINAKDLTGSTIDAIATAEASITALLVAPETAVKNLNTASTSSSVDVIPYTATITSSDITYSGIYVPGTGDLLKIANVAAGAIGDGAAPILLKAKRLSGEAEGSLSLIFSEAIQGTPKTKDVSATGSALVLVATNVNDNNISNVVGGGTVGNGALTNSTIPATIVNDTATFYNVDNATLSLAALGKLGVSAGNTTFVGADANVIAAQEVNADAVVVDTLLAPNVKRIVAVENSTGFIKTVLVSLSEAVTAKGSPKASDFSVTLNGIVITPESVAIATDTLTITLPGDGIRRDLVGANGLLTYTNSQAATADYHDTDNNKLANFAGQTIEAPKNTKNLHIQEISGKLTTNGTAVVAKGTMVRADLVQVKTDPAVLFDGGSITVPCGDCSAGTVNIALADAYAGGLDAEIQAAKLDSKTSIPVFVEVNADGGAVGRFTKSARLLKTLPGAAEGLVVYNAQLEIATGNITGQVAGTVKFKDGAVGGQIVLLDTTYQTIDNGDFRMSVGVDDVIRAKILAAGQDNTFVMLSVKQPKDAIATLITSPVRRMANFLPFRDELSSAGTIQGILGTVNLSKIEKVEVADLSSGTWQLLALSGEINFNNAISNDPATGNAKDVERLFITIDPNGAPITLWPSDTADKDTMFRLRNNVIETAFEAKQKTVSKFSTLNGGDGLAFQNMATGIPNDYRLINATNTGAEVNDRSTLFIPVKGTDVSADMLKGWSLITSVAPITDFAANNIEAVIKVGGGIDSASWFKGAVNNTLTATKAKQAYFVYFGAPKTGFKFGK